MPIVTAVVVSVAAAIATTTVATVAAAAVAVGTLVGTVGLGISVIGMATGNESLTKIGGYLGMAGGAMGLAGGLAGGMAGYMKSLSTAWDDGVGSLFSSTKPVGQEALGRGIVAGANPQAGAAFKQAGQQIASQADLGRAIVSAPTGNKLSTMGIGLDDVSHAVGPDDLAAANRARNIQGIANADQFPSSVGVNPSLPSGAPSASASMAQNTAGAVKPLVEAGSQVVSKGMSAGDVWRSIPDWAKGQLAVSGAQGLSGMLGGWFEAASAEERLELERQAQAWRQQHDDRNQAFAQKNASYAPLMQFGAINKGTA